MQLDLRGLDELDVEERRVLVRVDFNVPLDDDCAVTDDTRIRESLPTIKELLSRRARPVLLSHLGRPSGKVVDALRLGPVARRLEELLDAPVIKLEESIGPKVEAAIAAAPRDGVVLLENVRFHPGEEKGDPALAAAFACLGERFVNDAFGAAHRDHASVCGIARLLPSAAGRLVQKEIDAFRRVLESPDRPFVAILGGAKVSDKLKVIENLLDKVDALLVGGGMAYTFLKAQGIAVGRSLVQDDQLELVRAALAKARAKKVELLLPVDHVVSDKLAPDARGEPCGRDVPDGKLALDIGERTREAYVARIRGARTVVWNGPMGVFEHPEFRAGTEAIGRAVADCAGFTVVGGGDSVAAIELLGLADEIDHISTGGGASLELLEGRVLPGLDVLRK